MAKSTENYGIFYLLRNLPKFIKCFTYSRNLLNGSEFFTSCLQEGETKDQTFTLASMKIHERYDDVTFENDIAILKLAKPVTFTRNIRPICLPKEALSREEFNAKFAGKKATAMGWGMTFNGSASKFLKHVELPISDKSVNSQEK